MRNLFLTAAIASIGLAAGPVRAADKYFAYGPGTDTWDTVSSFWSAVPGGPYVGTWSASDNATFEGTAGAVSIGGTQLANRVTFSTDGYSLTNGALVLTGEATIANAVNAAVSSALIGTSDIMKTGAGTLTLSGANTFTGNVTINAGTVQMGTYTALGPDNNVKTVTVGSGATLDMHGYVANGGQGFFNTLNLGGTLMNTAGGGGYMFQTGWAQNYNVNLTGDATINIATPFGQLGPGYARTSLNLNGKTLTKSGGGQYVLENTDVGIGNINITAGSIYLLSSGVATTRGTVIQGTGTITVGDGAGGGIFYLDQYQTAGLVTRPIVLNGGHLRAVTGAAFVDSPISVAAGTTSYADLDNAGANLTLSGAITGSGTLVIGNFLISGSTLLSGDVSGFSGTLNYVDNAAGVNFRLEGASTNFSNVAFNLSGSTSTNGRMVIWQGTSGATLQLGSLSGTGGVIGGGTSFPGTACTLQVGALGGNTAYAGVIQDNGAGITVSLAKVGTGTLLLSGANTYTGATTVNGGTLELAGNNGWNQRAGTYIVNSSANLKVTSNAGLYNVGPNTVVNVNGGGALLWNALGGEVNSPYINAVNLDSANGVAATVSSTSSSGPRFGYVNDGVITSAGLVPNTWTAGLTLANGSGKILTIHTAQDLTISGVIQDLPGYAGTPITKSGAGTLILTAANTYSGATTIGNGALRIGAGSTITNSAAIVLGTNAVFDVSATGFTLGSGKALQGSGSVTGNTAAAAGAAIVAGPPGRAGTLTFNGNLALNAGVTTYFDLAGTTNAGGANDLILVNGDFSPSNATIAVNMLATPANGAYELFGYTGAKPSSFSPVLSGLPVPTRRTFALDEASTPHQVMLVVGGSPADLAWRSSTNTLWDAGVSPDWLNTGTGSNEAFQAFDTVAFDDTPGVVTAVELSGVLRPASIAIDASTHSFSFTGSGRLAGSTGIAKTGTNTLTMATSGTNDITGPVLIGAGTLIVAGTSPRPLGSGTITNDGTLAITRTENLTMDNPITGGGPLLVSGGCNLTLGASNTYTGGTTISAGAVVMGSDTALGSGAVSLNGSGLARDHAGSTVANNIEIGVAGGSIAGRTSLIDDYVHFTGILSGGGALSAHGLVSLENPANTYSGALTVFTNYSHLRLAASEVLGDTASITLSGTGSYLRLDSGVTETIDGFGGGAGSVVFGVGQGATATLRVGANNASSSYAGTITDLDNVLALVKLGAGTLTLGGASSYSGGTTISRGTVVIGNNKSLGTAGTVTLGDAGTGGSDVALLLDGTIVGWVFPRPIVVSSTGTGTAIIGTTTGSTPSLVIAGSVQLNRATTFQGLNTDRTTYTGVISGGVGTLTIAGGSRTTMENSNTFAGNVVVAAPGTILQVGNPDGGQHNQIPDSCSVDLGYGTRFWLAFGDSEAINVLTGSGTVEPITAHAFTLTLGAGDGSGTFSGVIQNANSGTIALSKSGSGIQALGGTNTYTGATTVNNGALLVNGNNSGGGAVTVAYGATLGGSGRVAGPVSVNTGGRLAPGPAGPGTLTLDGGLALQDGAALDFELGPASDMVLVRGTFTGAGTGGVTITISNRDGFSKPSYTLLDWSGATPAGVELTDFVVNPQIPIAYRGTLAIEGTALVWRVGLIPGSVLTVR